MVTQSKDWKNHQQPILPLVHRTGAFPEITYVNLMDMLDVAQLDVGSRYAHVPQLCAELQTQFRDGIHECNLRQREPVDLLLARLRGERRVCDAYNKHRLGNTAHQRYKPASAPEDAEERVVELGEDIEEKLESFPLRLEVVTRGFDMLTENLPPIYQAAGHTLQLAAAKTQQTPATPQNVGNAKAKTPTTDTPSPTQTVTGRAADNYDKLQSAPAPNLGFPVGYMTVAEMAAFHPNALKSWDMIDRFCGNGGSQATFAAMINHFREMERGRILPNSVYRMMKGSMNKRAKVQPEYITWTTGNHHDFPKARSFNPASVSVTGFRTPADGKIKATAPPIPIKNMANGVKNFPTGYDALDLTRAVRYCQAHPDENWLYPDDYERLVDQLPQDPHLASYPVGPAPVQVGHQDRATIERYTTIQMAAGVRNAFGRKRDRHGRLLKVKFKSDEECLDSVNTDSDADSERDVDFESLDQKEDCHKHFTDDTDDDEFSAPSQKPTNKRKKFNSNPRASRNSSRRKVAQSSRLPNTFSVNDFESASDNGAYEGPTKMKVKVKEVRRSMRATKAIKTYNVDQVTATDNEEPLSIRSKPSHLSENSTQATMSNDEDFWDDE